MKKITVPSPAAAALARLEAAGFEAWLVGGCVRDALLDLTAGDWDICTAALPEETEAVFSDCRIVETGVRHGTVTVLLEGSALEITTFRTEDGYSDGRHPDGVAFVRSLREDLSRRDFTCNAMAWHPERGLCDPFGGAADLRAGLLRCVGEPRLRFREDALRLLRALRFAARFGFTLEAETAAALLEQRSLLSRVSPERVFAELKGILCGEHAPAVLRRYAPVLFEVLPELRPLAGYEQGLRGHAYDAWEHTLHALEAAPAESTIRLAVLLHDAGKPDTRTTDEKGRTRYPGHGARSAELAEAALRRLRCDNAVRTAVCQLVALHDKMPPLTPAEARRELATLGEERTRQLYEVRFADAIGHGREEVSKKLALERQAFAWVEEALARGDCLSLAQLAVKGEDLLALGLRGEAVGRVLNALLESVIDGEAPNERAALLERAKELI